MPMDPSRVMWVPHRGPRCTRRPTRSPGSSAPMFKCNTYTLRLARADPSRGSGKGGGRVAYKTEHIRNLALVGHAAAGKTLLAEALLYKAGAIRVMGDLTRGTTVCDSDPMERELGHSIDTAVCHFDVQGQRVNLIDTPGYLDLLGRSQAVLGAVETAVIVVDAQSGIDIATRRITEAAVKRGLDRIIVINKIDHGETDLLGLLGQLRVTFGPQCLPINLPAEGGKRVVDCFFTREGPSTDFSSVEKAHRDIVEQVVEVDAALLERYLGGTAARSL